MITVVLTPSFLIHSVGFWCLTNSFRLETLCCSSLFSAMPTASAKLAPSQQLLPRSTQGQEGLKGNMKQNDPLIQVDYCYLSSRIPALLPYCPPFKREVIGSKSDHKEDLQNQVTLEHKDWG